MHFDVSIGKIKTLKPFISISSNLVILLILMPRFQILHFPGPEMAGLLKNCYQSFGFFQKQKFEKIDNINLTSFFLKVSSVMF